MLGGEGGKRGGRVDCPLWEGKKDVSLQDAARPNKKKKKEGGERKSKSLSWERGRGKVGGGVERLKKTAGEREERGRCKKEKGREETFLKPERGNLSPLEKGEKKTPSRKDKKKQHG